MQNNLYLVCFIGYLFGSIPFGLLLTKLAGMGDIRAIGSGNIGATNVLRTGNKKLAALTLLLDMLKGVAPVIIFKTGFCHSYWLWLQGPEPATSFASFGESVDCAPGFFFAIVAGAFAVFGHLFPVWLKFKGGKGVATTIGIYLGLSWPLGLTVITCWLAIFALTRLSSLAALIAIGLTAPLFCFTVYGTKVGIAATLLGLLVAFRHRSNIRRLLKGQEPRFGKK